MQVAVLIGGYVYVESDLRQISPYSNRSGCKGFAVKSLVVIFIQGQALHVGKVYPGVKPYLLEILVTQAACYHSSAVESVA